MKISLTLLTIFLFTICIAQENKFAHCNCIETLTEESYKVVSNGVEVESGQFESGKRTGTWVSKNIEGTIIRKASYAGGLLDGSYELFHFGGSPKLTAKFANGIPTGSWTYYNAKGKVIKQGEFQEGKPIGTWKVMDKKGKAVLAQYDFNSNSMIVPNAGNRYFEKGGILRDDQSGEWIITFAALRSPKTETQPLGGYVLSGDLFADYFNIPTIFMNTYAHFEFGASVKVTNGNTTEISVKQLDKSTPVDMTGHFLPFFVETNYPNKLTRVEHSEASINFIMDQLTELIAITGPWIMNSATEEFEIKIPVVINEVKRK